MRTAKRSRAEETAARAAAATRGGRSPTRPFPGGEITLARAQRLGHKVGASVTGQSSTPRNVVQRERYKVKERGSPPYGWLAPLATFLDEVAGAGNWGFSGSFAMYCWAWFKDGEARTPDDIDLLVAPGKFDEVMRALFERYGIAGKWRGLGRDDVNTTIKAEVEVVALDKEESKLPVSIDIILAGGAFGKIDEIHRVELERGTTLPLLSIKSLIGSKKEADFLNQMQLAFEAEEGTGTGEREKTKAEKDIEMLEALDAL